MTNVLDSAIANTQTHLLALRNARGHWEGELSSSALATATAVVALQLVDSEKHERLITAGVKWLARYQNVDGGWGDTTISKSNLSTTLLVWSALGLLAKDWACLCPDEISSQPRLALGHVLGRCETWIQGQTGSLEPDVLVKAVVGRYGKDKTFSVPILMTCALGGRLGEPKEAWGRVLALPFELAALPRTWFGAIGLPVVSYALPALIAIGHARFHQAPPAWWNPLRWLRSALWPRIRPMLKTLQPSTGGYLEATPLTSFVTMALAGAGEKRHPCVPDAVKFLEASQREDGSWPIDTNLATWMTTLSTRALCLNASPFAVQDRANVKTWLLSQQYKNVHPFTNAAPGGWAWTDLPGGVPDADDTSGTLVALWNLSESDAEKKDVLAAVESGVIWLLDLQNRDGGMPTFCRGWGTLPFDRSTAEITAHALLAWDVWADLLSPATRDRIGKAREKALRYLAKKQLPNGAWIPLWFGNENAPDEDNPVHGAAMVVQSLAQIRATNVSTHATASKGVAYLLSCQNANGGWGGAKGVEPTIEETANVVNALASWVKSQPADKDVLTFEEAIDRGVSWLFAKTENGTRFPAAPIGLYFARLWYHEKMYPVVWTLAALQKARAIKQQ